MIQNYAALTRRRVGHAWPMSFRGNSSRGAVPDPSPMRESERTANRMDGLSVQVAIQKPFIPRRADSNSLSRDRAIF